MIYFGRWYYIGLGFALDTCPQINCKLMEGASVDLFSEILIVVFEYAWHISSSSFRPIIDKLVAYLGEHRYRLSNSFYGYVYLLSNF